MKDIRGISWHQEVPWTLRKNNQKLLEHVIANPRTCMEVYGMLLHHKKIKKCKCAGKVELTCGRVDLW